MPLFFPVFAETDLHMANLKSSQKDIRRIEKRSEHNRGIRSSLKTLRKKVVSAASENAEQGTAAVREYSSSLDKAAKTGIIHKNKAARLKSRAAKALKA